MGFGRILKLLLEEHNLSQSTFAAQVGYSQRAVSKWINEQSEPTEMAIIKAAKFFNVTTDYLLGQEEDVALLSSNDFFLSPEERKLVEDYRGLAKPLKDLVQTVIKTMQEGTQNVDFKNGS